MSLHTTVPEVAFANIGGSGSWGYRFPEGVFESTWPLQVRRLESGLVFDTPYGVSPPFGLYELLDGVRGSRRQFLRVWMHGLSPGQVQATAEDPYAGGHHNHNRGRDCCVLGGCLHGATHGALGA